MKQIIITTLSILTLYSCIKKQEHNLTVEVDGWGSDSIIVITNDEQLDTLIAKNGVLTMDLDSTQESSYISLTRMKDIFQNRLLLHSKTINLMALKGEQITINGELNSGVLNYSNSQFEDFEELYTKTLPYDIAADSINMIIEVGVAKGDTTINPLFDKRGDEYEKIRDLHVAYIHNNPDSDFAGYLTMKINTIRFMECYSILSQRVKQGKYKALLDMALDRALKYEEYLAAKEGGNIAIDKPAPDFTRASIDGEQISLSDFRGKCVMLDFWGSWCGWCLKGVPNMKKFYDQHSSQIEIIAVACKDTPEKWRTTVEQYLMNWVNLFDDQGLSSTYAISGFPTKILIDPEGIIKHIQEGDSDNYYNEVLEIVSR